MHSTGWGINGKTFVEKHRPPVVGDDNQHGSHRKHVGGKRIF